MSLATRMSAGRVSVACTRWFRKSVKVANRESYYDVPKKLDMSAEPKKLDMSAEVEVSKEGEAGEPSKVPKRPIHKRLLDHWQLGFKLLELVSMRCPNVLHSPPHKLQCCSGLSTKCSGLSTLSNLLYFQGQVHLPPPSHIVANCRNRVYKIVQPLIFVVHPLVSFWNISVVLTLVPVLKLGYGTCETVVLNMLWNRKINVTRLFNKSKTRQ